MGKLLRNLTLGGILGFIAGMLFAPTRGEDARKKLQEAIEKGKEKFNELKEGFTKKEKED